MVHLVLSSVKGNQGLRYFPYVGYLGLTPVRIEGVVRTKVDDDAKHLMAKSLTISVRCYESRLGRVNVLHSNILVDYTQVLWSKADGVDYAPIEDLEYPFRITIPARVSGFSTAVFVDYRCMWRIEAVLNHIPITGVGSRQMKHFELPLIRYDLPPYEPPPPSPSKPLLLHQTTKPRAPRIRYAVITPTAPIGPLDIVSVLVSLLPMDDNVSIRSATMMIERRIQLNETVGQLLPSDMSSSSPLPIPSSSNPSSPRASPASSYSSDSNVPPLPHQQSSSGQFSAVETVASDLSSNPTITPHSIYPSMSSLGSDRPLLPHPQPFPATPTTLSTPSSIPSKTIVTPIIGAESTGHFSHDDQGVWNKTVTLQWPAAKSHSRWAIGETVQSELASVRFFARVKINVSSPNGTESIELSEKELLVVSTNEGERCLAISKYNELIGQHVDRSGRSKSKSPRRSRRELDVDLPPPPTLFKSSNKQSSSTGSVTASGAEHASGSGSRKAPTPRRPHTSAGPRDKKMFDFANARAQYPDPRADLKRAEEVFSRRAGDVMESRSSAVRPGTSQGVSSKRRSGVVGSLFSSAPRMIAAHSGSSNGTSASSSGSVSRSTSSSLSSQGQEAGTTQTMREWEEELAKIEQISRKTSDMLGFSFKRKRSAGAPRVET